MPFQTNFSMAVCFFRLISNLEQRFPLFVIKGECDVIGPALMVSHNDFKIWILKLVKFLLSYIVFPFLDLFWLRTLSLTNSFFFSWSVYILCLTSNSRKCHFIIWKFKVLVHKLRLLLWRMNENFGLSDTHWNKLG